MGTFLRACLFDQRVLPDETQKQAGGPAARDSFRPPFEHAGCLDIVAECATWQELQNLLLASEVDVVIVNLDTGKEDAALSVVQHIGEVAPQCGIIGVSGKASPDTIIAAMRAGCGQFVRWPVDPDDLRQAVQRLARARQPGGAQSRRICVVGSSGGAGATTVACNLTMELAQLSDQPCAILDLHLQYGDVACSFDVRPRHTLADVCCGGPEVDQTVIDAALEKLPCRVAVLARPEDPEQAELVSAERVAEVLRVLDQMFPFVVIDTPRDLNQTTIAALDRADHVLIVTQLAVPQLRNATRIYDWLLRLGADEQRIGVVLNRCNANFERIRPEQVEEHFKRPILARVANDYRRIGASRDLGHPIMSDAPRSPARLAIHTLAKHLMEQGQQPGRTPAGPAGRLGVFRKRPKARHPA